MKVLFAAAVTILLVATALGHGHEAVGHEGKVIVGGKVIKGYGGHGGHGGKHAEEEYVKHKIVAGPIGHDVHVYGPHQGHVSVVGGSDGSSLVQGPVTGDVGVVGPSGWGVSSGHGIVIGHGGAGGHGDHGYGYGHGHGGEKKW